MIKTTVAIQLVSVLAVFLISSFLENQFYSVNSLRILAKTEAYPNGKQHQFYNSNNALTAESVWFPYSADEHVLREDGLVARAQGSQPSATVFRQHGSRQQPFWVLSLLPMPDANSAVAANVPQQQQVMNAEKQRQNSAAVAAAPAYYEEVPSAVSMDRIQKKWSRFEPSIRFF